MTRISRPLDKPFWSLPSWKDYLDSIWQDQLNGEYMPTWAVHGISCQKFDCTCTKPEIVSEHERMWAARIEELNKRKRKNVNRREKRHKAREQKREELDRINREEQKRKQQEFEEGYDA